MTILPAFIPRRLDRAFVETAEKRLFRVAPDTQVLAYCHWQPGRTNHPTLIILHGLEGSSESSHVLAIAAKAFACGMNAVRLNFRNCGGTMHLTPTLYNAGLSPDLISVVEQLRAEGLSEVFAAGYSLGGNVVLKAAGELGLQGRTELAGVAAISPSIDLDLAVRAIEQPGNRIYDLWFLRTLKQKIKQKNLLFPNTFDLSLLPEARTLRLFDDLYTAPIGGYGRADNYYYQASALRVIEHIRIPTLIVAAEDDPLVPFSMFQQPQLDNPNVHLVTTRYGGHTGFVHSHHEQLPLFDRFWAENRIIEFCRQIAIVGSQPAV